MVARIGQEWMVGGLDVYQEHQASQVVASTLLDLIARAGRNVSSSAPLALGATTEGDPYVIPRRKSSDTGGLDSLDPSQIEMLSVARERALLEQLAECKNKLVAALARIEGMDMPAGADDPQTMAQFIASM